MTLNPDENELIVDIPTKEIDKELDAFDWIVDSPIDRKKISTTKRVATDRRTQLIQLYWLEFKTPTQIKYLLKYGSSEAVLDDLKKFDIPRRSPDQPKTDHQVQKQFDDKTALWGSILSSDGQEIISEAVDVKIHRSFQLFMDLRKKGDATYSYMKITIQFSIDEKDWFDSQDYPYTLLYEVNENLPTSWAISGAINSNYMRFKFESFKGDTLDSNNYFIIYSVNLVLG